METLERSSRRRTYAEKLLSPKWQRKRLHILELHDWTCESCGDTSQTLHVHHSIYRKNVEPWDYKDDEYQCLCSSCHKEVEIWKLKLAEAISKLFSEGDGLASLETVTGFAKGLLTLNKLEGQQSISSYGEAAGFGHAMSGLDGFFDDHKSGQIGISWPAEVVIDLLNKERLELSPEKIIKAVEKSRRWWAIDRP